MPIFGAAISRSATSSANKTPSALIDFSSPRSYTPSGTVLSAIQQSGTVSRVVADETGAYYVAGTTQQQTPYLSKYAADGTPLWTASSNVGAANVSGIACATDTANVFWGLSANAAVGLYHANGALANTASSSASSFVVVSQMNSTSGTFNWTSMIDGPGEDTLSRLAPADVGGVYAVGYTSNSSVANIYHASGALANTLAIPGNSASIVAKFDAAGRGVWGAAVSNASVYGASSDATSGKLTVSGSSYQNSRASHANTALEESSVAWSGTMDGNGLQRITRVICDPASNGIYVLGYWVNPPGAVTGLFSNTSTVVQGQILTKLDPVTQSVLWTRLSSFGYDMSLSGACPDKRGNLYWHVKAQRITNSTVYTQAGTTLNTLPNAFISKVDANGTLVWGNASVYGKAAGANLQPTWIAADLASPQRFCLCPDDVGGFYGVVGDYTGVGTSDAAGANITVYGADNSTKSTQVYGRFNSVLFRANAGGSIMWCARVLGVDTPTDANTHAIRSIVADGYGGVIATGIFANVSNVYHANGAVFSTLTTSGPTSVHGLPYVVRYDANGAVQIAFKCLTNAWFVDPWQMANDGVGNVYIPMTYPLNINQVITYYHGNGATAGTFTSLSPGYNDLDGLVIKYSLPNFTAKWIGRIGNSLGGDGFVSASADPLGVLVSGYNALSQNNGPGGNVSIYNANGTLAGTLPYSANNAGHAVYYDASGNAKWWTASLSNASTDQFQSYAAEIDPDRRMAYVAHSGNPQGGIANAAITTTANANIYVGTPTSAISGKLALSFNNEGSVLVRHALDWPMDAGAFVASYDSGGNVSSAFRIAGNAAATAVSVRGSNVYVAGNVSNGVAYHANTVAFKTVSTLGNAAYLAKYANGVAQWVSLADGNVSDVALAAAAGSNTITVVGAGNAMTVYDPTGNIAGTVAGNAFVVNYLQNGEPHWWTSSSAGNFASAFAENSNVFVAGNCSNATVYHANGAVAQIVQGNGVVVKYLAGQPGVVTDLIGKATTTQASNAAGYSQKGFVFYDGTAYNSLKSVDGVTNFDATTQAFSLELLACVDTAGTTTIYSKGTSMEIQVLANRAVQWQAAEVVLTTPAETVPGSVWKHITVTSHPNAGTALYLDGNVAATGAAIVGSISNSNNVNFMRRSNGTQYASGKIAMVRYWPRALTASDVSAAYASLAPFTASTSPGTIVSGMPFSSRSVLTSASNFTVTGLTSTLPTTVTPTLSGNALVLSGNVGTGNDAVYSVIVALNTGESKTFTVPYASTYSSSLLGGGILKALQTSRDSAVVNAAADTTITANGTYPGGGAFAGGVLMRDGRVFCVPRNATTARIYDPVANTVSTPSGTYPGSIAYVGGVLLADGRVFCVPYNATTARIYDPATDTLTTPTGTYPGAYSGGVLLPDGRVFCVPRGVTTARIYNPLTDTLATPSGTYPAYPGSDAYVGGVLLPDGRVFCVPYNATTARIYDPLTDTLTTPTGTYPGSGAYSGGALLPDGRVFCVPRSATTTRIYDPATDTLSTPTGTYPGSASYTGGPLLQDGRVFCTPRGATTAQIYNPLTDTLTTPGGTYPGSDAYIGGVLMRDGRVFCVPNNSTSAQIFVPGSTVSTPLSNAVVLSTFLNKF